VKDISEALRKLGKLHFEINNYSRVKYYRSLFFQTLPKTPKDCQGSGYVPPIDAGYFMRQYQEYGKAIESIKEYVKSNSTTGNTDGLINRKADPCHGWSGPSYEKLVFGARCMGCPKPRHNQSL
jgi:hypothetical protein